MLRPVAHSFQLSNGATSAAQPPFWLLTSTQPCTLGIVLQNMAMIGSASALLAGFDGGTGENQAFNLPLHQQSNGQNGGQECLACACRANCKSEIMAFDRVHIFLLAQRAWTQEIAFLTAGQHLLAHVLVRLTVRAAALVCCPPRRTRSI